MRYITTVMSSAGSLWYFSVAEQRHQHKTPPQVVAAGDQLDRTLSVLGGEWYRRFIPEIGRILNIQLARQST